jgi:hypothetical protein
MVCRWTLAGSPFAVETRIAGGNSGGGMNDRRKLIFALGARALTAPFGSSARQPAKMYRIGFPDVGSGAH